MKPEQQQINSLEEKVRKLEAVVAGLSMDAQLSPEIQRTIALAINQAISEASIDSFEDVIISSPSNGQVLKYNGTYWYNGTDIDT